MRLIFQIITLVASFGILMNYFFTVSERKTRTVRVADRYFIGQPQKKCALDCSAIFRGDENEVKKGIDLKTNFLHSDDEIVDISKNCSALKSLGYITKPVSRREESFPIAFNILMYKDVAQVEFLLRTIYRPQNVYCIHVDKSVPEIRQQMEILVSCFHNVFIVSKPVSIIYAGFSRLQADINCMQDLIHHPIPWKYLINVSGQMFPLRTNEEMVRILEIYNGANDIELAGYGIRYWWRFRIKYKEIRNETTQYLMKTRENNPPLPFGLEYVKGSAYGIFSRAFVRFVLEDEKAHALLEWSKSTYSPDEMYWSTLHHIGINPQLNTPGGYNATDKTKHPWLATYAGWCGYDPCHSGYCVRGICIHGLQDLNMLIHKRHFSLNKLYAHFQPAVGVCLAERLWNKTFTSLNDTDFDYYRKLPFIYPK